jgi:dolichol kinase
MVVLMSILIITGILLVWNLVVIHYISRGFYEFFNRYKNIPAEYVGRKIVHIFGGGLTAILIPIFYDGHYQIVAVMAFLLAAYVFLRRRYKMMYWFQIEENAYEVNFALAYGSLVLIGIYLEDVWIGLIPILFMSFGDAVTGLVRAFTQKKRVKSWDGTIAMFLISAFIGYWRLGVYGIVLAAIVSIVEKIPKIDDNVTVPIVAAVGMYLRRYL